MASVTALPVVFIAFAWFIANLTYCPGAVADAGFLSRLYLLARAPLLFGVQVHETDLLHPPLGILPAQVAVVFHHLRVGVADPLADLALRRTAEEGLAHEEVAEAVQAAVLEADLALGRGELALEWLDYFVDERFEHVSRPKLASALGVEHTAVGGPRHLGQQLPEAGVNRDLT